MVRVNGPSGQASALYDSEATEDECDVQGCLASQESELQQSPPKRKRVSRGRRALQQLLKDPHASSTRPLARHDAAFKAAIQRGCAAGVERPRRRSVPTPRFSIPHATTPTLHVERDATIFQLVLEKRPFLIHRSTREEELLGMVVRALKPNGVWTMTRESVQRQIEWLGHVLLDEDHTDHTQLQAAPALRDMVAEYYETSDTDLAMLLKRLNDEAQTHGITFDDVLLQEVRARRPFAEKKTKTRTVNAAWDELVTALNGRLGVKVFFSGASCKDRITRLRTVARGMRSDPQIELTEAQREMLVELEDMVGTPAAAKRRRQHGPNEVEEVKPEEIPYVALAAEDEGSTDEREVKRSRRASPHAPVHRNESLPMAPHESPSTDSVGSQQRGSGEVDVLPREIHAHRIKHSMNPGSNTRTSDAAVQEATVISPKLEETHTDPVIGFGESYAERVTLQRRVEWLEATVHTLQARVQDTEALSAAWAQQLAEERQRHHAHVEMLMDLLKSEREAQRQETRAMLDTVAAERYERYERPFVQLPPLLRYHNGGSSVVESGAMRQEGSSRESPFSTRLPRPW